MSLMTRTPLSISKGQRSTCRGGAYCGGLPHRLFSTVNSTIILKTLLGHYFNFSFIIGIISLEGINTV